MKPRPIHAAIIALLTATLAVAFASAAPLANPTPDAAPPANLKLTGDADLRLQGEARRDNTTTGPALESGKDLNHDNTLAGAVTQDFPVDPKQGRWYQFTFRGLPEDGFKLADDTLYMRAEYFGDHGKTSMDGKEKKLYDLIEQDRKDLAVNGDRKTGGAAVWKTYSLTFFLPFPQIDTVRLSVGFTNGKGSPNNGAFFVNDFKLQPVDGPADGKKGPILSTLGTGGVDKPKGNLIPLGGRWFYLAKDGESAPPAEFNFQNADRLIYHDNIWGTPFAGMMTATLRAGDKDADGNVVTKDTELLDNVTVKFDATAMIIHTKDIPNHPTGQFPETMPDGHRGNPNRIGVQDETFYIPLNPKERTGHTVTTADNSNHALPMGPIGIAVNGVVFFNPFDLGNTDATNMMDRCCGHPNQMDEYHYHKYPICINSPWADEGKDHSPLIGWAFDGYPLYGPYAKANTLAKDIKGDYALNDFNGHTDADRGFHYQVTPGKFPYLIGGYWGTEDPRDKHGPGMGGPAGQGGPGGAQGTGPAGGPGAGRRGPPPMGRGAGGPP